MDPDTVGRVLLLAIIVVPWAIVGLVAIIRGYGITLSRNAHRKDDGESSPKP